MDEYLPWRIRFFRAMELTMLGHVGLWLATYDRRGWARIVVAIIFLPTILGIAILWWHAHIGIGAMVLGWLILRLFRLINGSHLEVESL